jgi:hypothetical protein
MKSSDFKKGSLNYSDTKLKFYKIKQLKNREYVFGFLTGFVFNFFAAFSFFFIKSKHFREGVFVGWIYFVFFVFFFIIAFFIDLKVNQRILT